MTNSQTTSTHTVTIDGFVSAALEVAQKGSFFCNASSSFRCEISSPMAFGMDFSLEHCKSVAWGEVRQRDDRTQNQF